MLAHNGSERQSIAVVGVGAMPIDVHGDQFGGKFNGYCKRTVRLPLSATCGLSENVLGAQFLPGTRCETTGSADFIPSIAHAVKKQVADCILVRMNAGFNGNTLYTQLEAEQVHYFMRLHKDLNLERMVATYLRDDTSNREYVELEYQADSWECTRQVILVVKPRPGGVQ